MKGPFMLLAGCLSVGGALAYAWDDPKAYAFREHTLNHEFLPFSIAWIWIRGKRWISQRSNGRPKEGVAGTPMSLSARLSKHAKRQVYRQRALRWQMV